MSSTMPDWSNLRVFLELARTLRLPEAAQRLGIDHSTVSRRIRRLEQQLGTRLFDRSNQGFALTPHGEQLLEHVDRIESALLAATDELVGSNSAPSGTVRLGATEGFGSFFIAPHLAHFCARHPSLTVDVLPVPRFVNLSRHEADLAVSVERPRTDSHVVARLTEYRLGLYASRDYLKAHPSPRRTADLAEHPMIGYVDELVFTAELRYLEEVAPEARLPLRSTSVIAQYAAALQGRMIAILPCFLAQLDARLVPLLEQEIDIVRTFWLAASPDRRGLLRVDALWDYLRETCEANQDFLMGRTKLVRWLR